MRILIVRHGDPNYAIDGLTEKGKREAELLSHRLVREQIDGIYCSVLGRARATAAPTLQALGREAIYCDWLREFDYERVHLPYFEGEHLTYDFLPSYMEENPKLYSPTAWREVDVLAASGIPTAYDAVCASFDALLEEYGYVREGLNYRVEDSNHKTLLLVCHFGVTGVLLSHLMNCSPYSLWQNAVTLPTSVTTVYSEERRAGIASFRCAGIGDVSHLYAAGEAPSFSARWCECVADPERH